LEDTVLHDSDTLPLRGDHEGSAGKKVQAKVREIITKNLSTDGWATPTGSMMLPTIDQLREENRMLQVQLKRMDDILGTTRAERDEIGIKYNTISQRVSI